MGNRSSSQLSRSSMLSPTSGRTLITPRTYVTYVPGDDGAEAVDDEDLSCFQGSLSGLQPSTRDGFLLPEFLVPPTEGEVEQVLRVYHAHPVREYEIASIDAVQNCKLQHLFKGRLAQLQKKTAEQLRLRSAAEEEDRSAPTSSAELDVRSRATVSRQLEERAAPFHSAMFPGVKFLPVWRRVKHHELSRVLEFGYASGSSGTFSSDIGCSGGGSGSPGRGSCSSRPSNSSSNSSSSRPSNSKSSGSGSGLDGYRGTYYGRGVSVGCEAEYAWRAGAQGPPNGSGGGDPFCVEDEHEDVLVLSWAVLGCVFPVIYGDSSKLVGKARFQSYDGLYIPVVPCRKGYCEETYFRPTMSGETPMFTEVSVFDATQCLPRYVLRLRRKPRSLGGKEWTTGVVKGSGGCNDKDEISEEDETSTQAVQSVEDEKRRLLSGSLLTAANLQRNEERLLLEEMTALLEESYAKRVSDVSHDCGVSAGHSPHPRNCCDCAAPLLSAALLPAAAAVGVGEGAEPFEIDVGSEPDESRICSSEKREFVYSHDAVIGFKSF